jgi:hypothetical protein
MHLSQNLFFAKRSLLPFFTMNFFDAVINPKNIQLQVRRNGLVLSRMSIFLWQWTSANFSNHTMERW